MPFNTTYRYFAFDASLLQNVDLLREQLGEFAFTKEKNGKVKTLLCGPDNSDRGSIRAGILGETAIPIHLLDGRLCLGGFWVESIISEFESGNIDGEELTANEVKSLTLTEEI